MDNACCFQLSYIFLSGNDKYYGTVSWFCVAQPASRLPNLMPEICLIFKVFHRLRPAGYWNFWSVWFTTWLIKRLLGSFINRFKDSDYKIICCSYMIIILAMNILTPDNFFVYMNLRQQIIEFSHKFFIFFIGRFLPGRLRAEFVNFSASILETSILQ